MIVVSISAAEHDASLCILDNEKVLLQIQEERISRIKRDSSLPLSVLKLVKKYVEEIDILVFTNITFNESQYCYNCLSKDGIKINSVEYQTNNHHLYHAASAFYSSGFDDAICLVIDGWGSDFNVITDDGIEITAFETTSIYHADYPNNFKLLYKNLYAQPNLSHGKIKTNNLPRELDLNFSFDVGVVYGTTTHHIGFERLDAGKTMGLSSYGNLNSNIPNFSVNGTHLSDNNLFLQNRQINEKLYPYMKVDINDFNKKADISYKVQKYLEEVFLYRIRQALKLKPDCKNLVFSGGCALNILGNSLIKKTFPELNIFIDPIANDACQAYGSAKYHYYEVSKSLSKDSLKNVYSGPVYDLEDLRALVKESVLLYNDKER